MFIRYSYSPSFEEGWMIEVSLDANVVAGTTSWQIDSGRILTKQLARDAHIQLADLKKEITFSRDDGELKHEDWERLIAATSKVILVPTPFPWATLDGATIALIVEAGDTTLAAEWNSHPNAWEGLDLLHDTLHALFETYHKHKLG
jgi:hypothetical protein